MELFERFTMVSKADHTTTPKEEDIVDDEEDLIRIADETLKNDLLQQWAANQHSHQSRKDPTIQEEEFTQPTRSDEQKEPEEGLRSHSTSRVESRVVKKKKKECHHQYDRFSS